MGTDLIESLGDGKAHGQADDQAHHVDPWMVIFAHRQSSKHVVVQTQKRSLLKTILLRWKKHSTRLDLRRIAFVTYFCGTISCDLIYTPSYILHFLQP